MKESDGLSFEFAPAKINLALHITGKRNDGYHTISSLIAFAKIGDWICAKANKPLSLEIHGPESGALIEETGDNLILKSARLFPYHDAQLYLWKALPVASGIGGGSSDAAATARIMSRMFNAVGPDLLEIGSDMPICQAMVPALVEGRGECIQPYDGLPEAWFLLVNPRLSLPTGSVFSALNGMFGDALQPIPKTFLSFKHLIEWLYAQRNDLEIPAMMIAPKIKEVIDYVARIPSCGISRMSGSGATVFGLFPDSRSARNAIELVKKQFPDSWAASGKLAPSQNAFDDLEPPEEFKAMVIQDAA